MMAGSPELEFILDLARWAPSGDNTQPWRFEIISDDEVVVHIRQPRPDNPYEYNGGQPTWLAVGGLLEYIRVAASRWRRTATWRLRDQDSRSDRIDVYLIRNDAVDEDPLISCLTARSVDRRPYRRQPLNAATRERLERSLDGTLTAHWYTSAKSRLQWALINSRATAIRLSIPETYQVHRRMLDWESSSSPAGIPARAVGLDPGTTLLMKWAMKDWQRLDRLNRFLAGTVVPRLELDVLPGYGCAAFFALTAEEPSLQEHAKHSWLSAGAAFQRLWLEATRLGLVLQPTLAPLAFATHASEGKRFTTDPSAIRASERLASKVAQQLGALKLNQTWIIGRIGYPTKPNRARSTRLPLGELLAATRNGES